MQDIKTNLIKCTKVLVKTGIQIAPYVVNPYRGCGFGCIYCYSQKNKCFRKSPYKWGEFVDVKINCLEVLEKELEKTTPERVLLGSITEVYQDIEEKYSLTRGVIEILNKHNIPLIILTKSKLILRDLDILHNAKICFSINFHIDKLLRVFEPRSPCVEERINVVKKLREKGIYTYIHVGPVIPGFTEIEKIMDMCRGITDRLDFESFNYWMSPVEDMDKILTEKGIFNTEDVYNGYWNHLRNKIIGLNIKFNYRINFYFHPYKSYFPVSANLTH